MFSGKDRKRRELIERLDSIFSQIQDEYDVSPGDFPDVRAMRDKLANAEWGSFKTVERHQIQKLDKLLSEDMTKLMQANPKQLFTNVQKSYSTYYYHYYYIRWCLVLIQCGERKKLT